MRTFQLVIVSLLATAALASATASHTWLDAAGDETLTFRRADPSVLGVRLDDCHNAAADIRSLAFTTDDETLTLRLTMASLADLRSKCQVISPNGARGEYEASWREVLEDDDVTGFPGGIRATAFTTGFGLAGCVLIQHTDDNGASSDCIGAPALDGNSVVWAVPITGTHVVEVCEDASCLQSHEEERTYDFRGFTGEIGGNSDVRLQSQISFFGDSFTDFVTGDLVTG